MKEIKGIHLLTCDDVPFEQLALGVQAARCVRHTLNMN